MTVPNVLEKYARALYRHQNIHTYIPSCSLVGIAVKGTIVKTSIALRIGGRLEFGVFLNEHE